MSLLFVDSFDHYFNVLDKYDIILGLGSQISIQSAIVRNGSAALKIFGGNIGLQKNISAQTTLIAGFAFQLTGSPVASAPIISFLDGNTSQIGLLITSTGNFQFFRGGGLAAGYSALLGSQTSYALSFSTWHYLEVKVTIDGSAGVAELKVDGNYIIQLSGQNTKATSNASASALVLGVIFNNGTEQVEYYDDLYLLNTSGSVNNTYLGDVKIQASFPTGNGTLNNYTQNAASWVASTVMFTDQQIIDSNGNLQRVTNFTGDDKTGSSPPTWSTGALGSTTTDNHVTWTLIQKAPLSNYNFINEPLPDDNQSYLSDATVSDQDRYTFGAVSGASVFGVAVNMRAQKDDSATRSIRSVTKSSTTVADNGTDFPLAENAYTPYQGFFEVDPNTTTAWTISGVNAAEFGIKTTA
jgi:hypothetical protein